MSRIFSLRLLLDLAVAALLLFAFAYHWQGNRTHEVTGILIFTLLVAHAVFHRRWFVAVSSGGAARRGRFNVALTLVLLAGMSALLIPSPMISETVVPGLRLDDDFTARRIHAGVAYWLLLIVGLHLGLRWPLLMGIAGRMLGLGEPNALRSAAMRLVAASVAVQGAFSALALNLPTRLSFQLSLDWWNFEESVAGFFGHCAAVAGLCMVVTYYATSRLQRPGRAAASLTHQPQREGRT